jgi:c-di-GMP-binding flagellar brake protein YcgR
LKIGKKYVILETEKPELVAKKSHGFGFFCLYKGEEMKTGEERRQHPRIGISFPVECKILPSRKYFYTVSKDLSLVGARIIANTFIAKDNFLTLSVNLIDRVLDLKARVVWCNKDRIAERYSAGLQFVEIDEKSQKDLSQFLNKIYPA